MLLSTNIRPIMDRYGFNKALDMIKEAGFVAYDMDFDVPPDDLVCDGWQENVRKMREYADSKGMVCNQAHAPFPVAIKDDDIKTQEIFGRIVMAIEGASILGAKNIVVHGADHLYSIVSSEKLREYNMDLFKRLIPYCQKFKVNVAVENVWGYKTNTFHILPGFCGMVEDFNRYIDELDSPFVVGCVDIGHIALTGSDVYDWIVGAGKRVKALHIHDNNYLQDSHYPPFLGDIDFGKVIKALKDIEYCGDLTLEISYRNIPDKLMPIALQYAYGAVEYLKEQLEN